MGHPTGLRLCVASSGLGHVTRGIETWAADLGRVLAERDEQILLCKGAGTAEEPYERVVSCWTRSSKSARRLLSCLPHSVAWRIGLGSPYGVEQTTFALNLVQILRDQRVDVLHLQDPQVAVVVQHAHRLGWVPTRTILNHGTEEPLEFLDRITYVQHGAPWHAEQAEANGVWKDSWTVIPNFVDTERFVPGNCQSMRDELSIPEDAFVLLVSSAIKPRHKRIDKVLAEVARVLERRPEARLWLVVAGGESEETSRMIQIGKRLLGDRVQFLVGVPHHRMPDLYRMADVLVHGSLKEMMPMTLLEATACGLPCVIHSHPVMQWMVGEGGIAVDQRIEGVAADAIIELMDNPAKRNSLGIAARQHCQSQFSRNVVVDQIQTHYRRVAHQQAERAA